MSLNLDKEVRRIALLEARKFIARGLTVEQAVARACKGNWAYQSEGVKMELHKITPTRKRSTGIASND